MLILSLETSGSWGGFCISQDSQILLVKKWEREKSQSEFLTQYLQESLNSLNLNLDQFDAYAVNQGPGSFTGIRIGLSVIKSLAYMFQKPVAVAHALEVMVTAAPISLAQVRVVLTGFRNLVYTADFDAVDGQWNQVSEVRALTADQIPADSRVLFGNGIELFDDKVLSHHVLFDAGSSSTQIPDPTLLHQVALRKIRLNKTSDWKSIHPLYIRDSEAEEKLRSGQLKPFKGRPT